MGPPPPAAGWTPREGRQAGPACVHDEKAYPDRREERWGTLSRPKGRRATGQSAAKGEFGLRAWWDYADDVGGSGRPRSSSDAAPGSRCALSARPHPFQVVLTAAEARASLSGRTATPDVASIPTQRAPRPARSQLGLRGDYRQNRTPDARRALRAPESRRSRERASTRTVDSGIITDPGTFGSSVRFAAQRLSRSLRSTGK